MQNGCRWSDTSFVVIQHGGTTWGSGSLTHGDSTPFSCKKYIFDVVQYPLRKTLMGWWLRCNIRKSSNIGKRSDRIAPEFSQRPMLTPIHIRSPQSNIRFVCVIILDPGLDVTSENGVTELLRMWCIFRMFITCWKPTSDVTSVTSGCYAKPHPKCTYTSDVHSGCHFLM
jgi:hypothetical protein